MKSKEVLKILNVTRQTLTSYVKKDKIKVIILPNGFYNYNEDDVYKLIGIVGERESVIYCRVSTQKQKHDLINQEMLLNEFCAKNDIIINDKFIDIGSGINYDRKEFKRLLDKIMEYKIKLVYITYKDRLSRISFDMFSKLFSQFGCSIVVINDTEDKQTIEQEIFSEIISLLHCFSMKMYSSRRKKKLELVKQDLENDID
ncbi:MAG TPA: IS607 family transposase [Burkholderiales bacterium]|nr:IS607 family transposase [Burkholderiales bacterium]